MTKSEGIDIEKVVKKLYIARHNAVEGEKLADEVYFRLYETERRAHELKYNIRVFTKELMNFYIELTSSEYGECYEDDMLKLIDKAIDMLEKQKRIVNDLFHTVLKIDIVKDRCLFAKNSVNNALKTLGVKNVGDGEATEEDNKD